MLAGVSNIKDMFFYLLTRNRRKEWWKIGNSKEMRSVSKTVGIKSTSEDISRDA